MCRAGLCPPLETGDTGVTGIVNPLSTDSGLKGFFFLSAPKFGTELAHLKVDTNLEKLSLMIFKH